MASRSSSSKKQPYAQAYAKAEMQRKQLEAQQKGKEEK